MKKLDIFTSFIKDPRNTSYEGKDSDEEVKILVRKSLLTTIGWIILTVVLSLIPFILGPLVSSVKFNGKHVFDPAFVSSLGLFWYVFVFGFILQNFLNWYFEVLLITNKKIVDIDEGCTNISETQLRNIQDVTSKMNSIWGQVFNIGSLLIQTAAEKEEFEFRFVDNPSVIRDAISDLVSRDKRNEPSI